MDIGVTTLKRGILGPSNMDEMNGEPDWYAFVQPVSKGDYEGGHICCISKGITPEAALQNFLKRYYHKTGTVPCWSYSYRKVFPLILKMHQSVSGNTTASTVTHAIDLRYVVNKVRKENEIG